MLVSYFGNHQPLTYSEFCNTQRTSSNRPCHRNATRIRNHFYKRQNEVLMKRAMSRMNMLKYKTFVCMAEIGGGETHVPHTFTERRLSYSGWAWTICRGQLPLQTERALTKQLHYLSVRQDLNDWLIFKKMILNIFIF